MDLQKENKNSMEFDNGINSSENSAQTSFRGDFPENKVYPQPNPYGYPVPNYPTNPKPKCIYSETDRFFAVVALVLGYFALEILKWSDLCLGFLTAVFCICLTLFNFFYCRRKGLNGDGKTKFIFITSIVLSVFFAVTDNQYVTTINFGVVLVSNLYFVYSSYHSNNNSIILNAFKSVFISPFYEYASVFGALFHKSQKPKDSDSKSKSQIMSIVCGLVLSIPVFLVVLALLMSSDSNFGAFFRKLTNWFFGNFSSNILQFVLSLPIGMYIFGAVYSRAYKMQYENELTKLPKSNKRVFPSAMCNAFLTPISLLYVAFVFTQVSYLFRDLNKVSENFSYSEYARSGFFELCFVALINLSAVSAIMFFVKLKDNALPKSVRGFISAFSVLTLCLIVTAIVKMFMYISIYGMTPLRVYTSVFMAYLFVMFIVLIVKQFKSRISFTSIAYVLAVCVLAVLSLVPVDGFIAKYNIQKYEQGEIEWMGREAMLDLDSTAVIVFANSDYDTAKIPSGYGKFYIYPIRDFFSDEEDKISHIDAYNFTITKYIAYRTADKNGWLDW